MNFEPRKCCCGILLKSERAWKFHINRCDCGRTKDLVKFERMRSPIFNEFLDKLFISVQALYLEDNLDRFTKFFHEALIKINRADISFYIKELKNDGVVLVKGLQDLTLRKEEDDYISFEWINLSTKDFFDYMISYLNKRIDDIAIEKNLVGYKLLVVDDLNTYLRELRKITK